MLNVGGGSTSFGRRPPAVLCQICGRLFGTASISIHMKACTARFLEEESKKPKAQRRALPQFIEGGSGVGGGGGLPSYASMTPEELDARNDAAMKNFNDAVLQKCANCGRTFLPDRLAIHHRSCTPDNPARRVGEKGVANGGAPTTINISSSAAPAAAPAPAVSAQRAEASPARPASSASAQRPATSAVDSRSPARAAGGGGGGPAPSSSLQDAVVAGATGLAEPSQPRTPSRRSSGGTGPTAGGRRPSGGVSSSLSSRPIATNNNSSSSSSSSKGLEAEWRTSVAERLALLATRLAYLQETLLAEVADIQEEVSDLADEIAGEAEVGAGWGPSTSDGGEDGKGGDD
jgi:hypothetical protein